jgi:hypothetical protein
MYMANMAWNSSMNTRGVMEMLTDTDETGAYVIPRITYSDAYSSEMVAYADLILPDTTYLERHDCISPLDRPICEADAAADAIRWPVIEPAREVRGFQTVLVQLANKLKLRGFTAEDGTPRDTDHADYIVNHERKPGIGPLAGFCGTGEDVGRGAPNPAQIDHYIENGGLFASRPITCATRSRPRWTRCRSGIPPSRTRASTRANSHSTPSRNARWRCITPGVRKTPGYGRSTGKPALPARESVGETRL